MAKDENTESAPALIDYAGASAASKSASEGNAFADCKSHWKRALFKEHRVGGLLWGIKEQTNLSRLLRQFDAEDIKKMMDSWAKHKKIEHATNLNMFYAARHTQYELIKPKDYDW